MAHRYKLFGDYGAFLNWFSTDSVNVYQHLLILYSILGGFWPKFIDFCIYFIDSGRVLDRSSVVGGRYDDEFCIKFIIFNAKIIIFNAEIIIFNAKIIIFDTKFIRFNTKFRYDGAVGGYKRCGYAGELCTEIDEFCIKNDEFCIKNVGSEQADNARSMLTRSAGWDISIPISGGIDQVSFPIGF